jgi:hypothetical protein
VGLVDRAVVGDAPDQRETGRLRLTGDKMFVTDGWDYQNGRWFNGFAPLPLDQVRRGVADAVNNYLSWESWALGASPNSWAIESTFQRKRADRVSAIDPRQVTSRFFEGTTASIERFETIEGIWSGIATVRLDGTIVTTNAAGATTREKFTRMVRAFVLGNWLGEVVDEQGTNGEWASEGDLALQQIDVNRA